MHGHVDKRKNFTKLKMRERLPDKKKVTKNINHLRVNTTLTSDFLRIL